MSKLSGKGRTDSASRLVRASPSAIYRAFVDPAALASWLPPAGMKGRVDAFDATEGGAFRITLMYESQEHVAPGKTSDHADVVRGRFVELVPGERIVQQVEFESANPAFAGIMTITWRLAAVAEGTDVTVLCENVPEGIRREDHETGLRSSLANLAAFTE
ncbi:MAG: SRPBCC family protein [Dichotomicrobium sp.]